MTERCSLGPRRMGLTASVVEPALEGLDLGPEAGAFRFDVIAQILRAKLRLRQHGSVGEVGFGQRG